MKIKDIVREDTDSGDIVPIHDNRNKNTENPMFLLEEKGRPGELMPAYEDENGTYLMNSKDLCAIEHIKEMRGDDD